MTINKEDIIKTLTEQISILKTEYGTQYGDKNILSFKNWDTQTGVLITGEQAEAILKMISKPKK